MFPVNLVPSHRRRAHAETKESTHPGGTHARYLELPFRARYVSETKVEMSFKVAPRIVNQESVLVRSAGCHASTGSAKAKTSPLSDDSRAEKKIAYGFALCYRNDGRRYEVVVRLVGERFRGRLLRERLDRQDIGPHVRKADASFEQMISKRLRNVHVCKGCRVTLNFAP